MDQDDHAKEQGMTEGELDCGEDGEYGSFLRSSPVGRRLRIETPRWP